MPPASRAEPLLPRPSEVATPGLPEGAGNDHRLLAGRRLDPHGRRPGAMRTAGTAGAAVRAKR